MVGGNRTCGVGGQAGGAHVVGTAVALNRCRFKSKRRRLTVKKKKKKHTQVFLLYCGAQGLLFSAQIPQTEYNLYIQLLLFGSGELRLALTLSKYLLDTPTGLESF